MAAESEGTKSGSTEERFDALVRQLGYQGHQSFLTTQAITESRLANHVIRQALTAMGIRGIFALADGFRPSALKPIVYLASADDGTALHALRKDVWSQGAVPFLLVVTPDKVEVCHGFEPPSARTISVDYDPNDDSLPDILANFAADRISSSITWSNLEIRRDSSVDNNLVGAIEALNERARREFPDFKRDKDLINALIGKFLYIYVLVDRHILSIEWLIAQLAIDERADGQLFLQAIFGETHHQNEIWSARAVMSVFNVVDAAINGSVFTLSATQQARIPDGLCHLIHRVIRRGEVLQADSSQPSFFNVSFNVLRTETISAIYERFVSIEDADRKRDEGVFYTPPHLADHVLDRVDAVSPITNKSRLIDPAAGSGIFLVGAYRRLMERHAPADGWHPRHINLAKSLLLEIIHGVEKHPQAANVCRFSLYLTLLDYVGRDSIEKLIEASGQSKFLPDLTANIRSADAFATEQASTKYTHVIGNPPWAATGGQKDRTNRNTGKQGESSAIANFVNELKAAKIAFGHNRLSDLFTWLAVRRLAGENAVIAFLLPAHSLIGRQASNFAHCLAREATVSWVGNLSHLRRKLFDGVEAPACVVVAVNRPPGQLDRTSVYRPLLSSLPGGRKSEIWSLLASNADIQMLRSQDLQRGPNGWFLQSMLGELDRRMHDALATWAKLNQRTLGDFLSRSGLFVRKGGSPAETGIRRRKVGNRSVQLHHLDREALLHVKADFRGFFSGNVILIPRSLNAAIYHRDPVAYPSTFNAIIPESQYQDSVTRPIAARAMPYMATEFVDGFLKYINSIAFKYFASLFGATYLMDQARLEKNDLLSLPCPFRDARDRNLLDLADSYAPDDNILRAMNAGKDFRAAFEEFVDFRRYFANAQVPADSLKPASEHAREIYLNRLVAEIQTSFGPKLTVEASVETAGRQTFITIAFGRRPKVDVSTIDVTSQFLGSSIVVYDRDAETSIIVKSPTRHAWTIDQAVADGIAVSREIRSRH